MPVITVELDEGNRTIEVQSGKKLVLALEDNGIDISHRCGGNAKCTTCRCSFSSGEPDKMTQAEKEKISASIENGDEAIKTARLSCQILIEEDMTVKPLMRIKDMDWDQAGGRPADSITPDPVWTIK
ncbi:MAG: Rhodocoxin [Candidatus Heimdallarchaeota archaeon LC_2]|nr:MAG: Rhodocoxin [Candidatus Heimdallarchaeota archaeon LC_2]